MRKKIYIIVGFLVLIIALGVYSGQEGSMFGQSSDMLVRAIVYGVLIGGIRAVIRPKQAIVDGKVIRHDAASFIQHWGTAIGIFVLIISGALIGFFFLESIALRSPIPAEVDPETWVDPKTAWMTNVHFIGVAITLFCGFFFATDYVLSKNFKKLVPNVKEIIDGTLRKYLLRKPYHNEGKYLASQKAAFLSFAVLGAAVLITGFIKVGVYMGHVGSEGTLIKWTTYIHDISGFLFFLLLIVHVGVVVVLRHWPMMKSWMSGTVDEDLVKEEHPIWYEELKKDEDLKKDES
jgi:formate dehydrogenase gamma subunit|tara:strand:- start:276 stop:1148 length:873 start_codon:yes stop_codon:yes gene_type:complete